MISAGYGQDQVAKVGSHMARLKHRETIRLSEKTEDLRFPGCGWADNLTINHKVPFLCGGVPGTMTIEGEFEEKGKNTIENPRAERAKA